MKTAIALALLLAAPAYADLQGELQRCAAVEDSLERLRCFESLVEDQLESDSDCPIRFELERHSAQAKTGDAFEEKVRVGMFFEFNRMPQVDLNNASCPEHPHVEFIRAGSHWGRSTLTVYLEVRNLYATDRTARVDADFVLSDGSTVSANPASENIDSMETTVIRLFVKVPIKTTGVVSARVALRVLAD